MLCTHVIDALYLFLLLQFIIQLSNQAQASSVDGDNSLPAEPTWSAHQPRRHNIVTSPGLRTGITPPHFSTPPPPSSFEYYTPIEPRMRSSLPLNPWNPFLRSYGNYGRIYPYNVAVNQYDSDPAYLVMRESSSPERTSANYPHASRIQMVPNPPTTPPPPPPPQPQYCGFNNPMAVGEPVRRTIVRPHRNSSHSFHNFRHGVRDVDISTGYSSLPVEFIEISSSDEEDNREIERPREPTSFSRRHSEHNRPTCNRSSLFVRSPSHRVATESKLPNMQAGPSHMRPASPDDASSSLDGNYQGDEPLALSVNNRMKRPHRSSPHSPSKLYRRSHTCNHRTDNNYTPENISPFNGDEYELNGLNRSTVCINDSNIDPTSVASTSQSISNRMININSNSNNDNDNDNDNEIHHHNQHYPHCHLHNSNETHASNNINNDDTDTNSTEQNEQKFKIRIKREFKIEPNDSSENNENNENGESESVAVDTKAHLQPLIANIKQE